MDSKMKAIVGSLCGAVLAVALIIGLGSRRGDDAGRSSDSLAPYARPQAAHTATRSLPTDVLDDAAVSEGGQESDPVPDAPLDDSKTKRYLDPAEVDWYLEMQDEPGSYIEDTEAFWEEIVESFQIDAYPFDGTGRADFREEIAAEALLLGLVRGLGLDEWDSFDEFAVPAELTGRPFEALRTSAQTMLSRRWVKMDPASTSARIYPTSAAEDVHRQGPVHSGVRKLGRDGEDLSVIEMSFSVSAQYNAVEGETKSNKTATQTYYFTFGPETPLQFWGSRMGGGISMKFPGR